MKFESTYIKLIIGIIFISFSPLPVKVVVFSPGVSAFYRTLYAFVILLIISIFHHSKELQPIKKAWFWPIVLGGIFLGFDFTLWHKAILYIGAGPATFLGNSQIVFVTIFAVIFLKEPVSRTFPFLVGIIFFGLYLLVPQSHGSMPRSISYSLGLIIGILYAGVLICFRYAADNSKKNEYPEILSLAIVMFFATIVSAFFSIFLEGKTLLNWDGKSHLLMFAIAFLSQCLGWILIKKNITKMPAHIGSLFLLLQPVLSSIWGNLFFDEPLNFIQISGIVIAVGGIAFLILNKK